MKNKEVHIEELNISFKMLTEAMKLPNHIKIAAIHDGGQRDGFTIKLATTQPLPKNNDHWYMTDKLANIGDMFENPEKYRKPMKGEIRGKGIDYV